MHLRVTGWWEKIGIIFLFERCFEGSGAVGSGCRTSTSPHHLLPKPLDAFVLDVFISETTYHLCCRLSDNEAYFAGFGHLRSCKTKQ